jgi:hypothetical protein
MAAPMSLSDMLATDVGPHIVELVVAGDCGRGLGDRNLLLMMGLCRTTRRYLTEGSGELYELVREHSFVCMGDLGGELPWMLAPPWAGWRPHVRTLILGFARYTVGELSLFPNLAHLDWETFCLKQDVPMLPESVTSISVYAQHADAQHLDLRYYGRNVRTAGVECSYRDLTVRAPWLRSLDVECWSSGELFVHIDAPELTALKMRNTDGCVMRLGKLRRFESDRGWVGCDTARVLAANPVSALLLPWCDIEDGALDLLADLRLDVLDLHMSHNVDWGVLARMRVKRLHLDERRGGHLLPAAGMVVTHDRP